MTPSIFIMCAGLATRFNGICKQLLPLNDDQTILDRILEQTSEYKPFVVTHNQDILDLVYTRGITTILPASYETLCNSILSTQHRWTDRVIILLGDVVYSNRVMQDILTETDPLMFFGDEYEMYALTFSTESRPEIISALTEGATHPFGKLRYAYRSFANTSWKINETPDQLRADPHFHYVNCWVTRDCDSPGQYNNIIRELVNRHILEKE